MTGRPRRVLQVVSVMNRGGVETWLMNVLRRIDPGRARMDFLVHTSAAGAYDKDLLDRGCKLIHCPDPVWSPTYWRSVCGALWRYGPYDAVHSHLHHFNGCFLELARRWGVPRRIAHSHSDTSRVDRSAGWARRSYLRLATGRIHSAATCLAAVSRVAARALFGEGWECDPRGVLMPCGIDLEPFQTLPERSAIRASLGIEAGEFVMGHVGRFVTAKNHAFLAEVASEVVRRLPGTRLLLAGDGPLRGEVESRLRELGLGRNVVFAGVRPDVPRLLAAMDVFVFPSLWEGLPLALLEAQAAGLPCVVSAAVTGEADVVHLLVHRLAVSSGVAEWAAAVLAAAAVRSPDRQAALSVVERSSFNINRSLEQLYALYDA
jgi:glycosyltransferase involved in cell wall biosynthesis